jgi:hypothetical protein
VAKVDLRDFARRGAEARIAELNAELTSIYAAFPDLRRNGRTGRRGRNADAPVEKIRRRRRRRRALTPAEKKAISARMKKYWAERRKSKAT